MLSNATPQAFQRSSFMHFSHFSLSSFGFGRLLVAAFILCAAVTQAATVRAYVQPSTARPNQVINYVITVQDGQLQSLPNLRFPLQIGQTSGVSSSQQIQIVNGRQSVSTHLSWGITATEPGEFVIPTQTVVVDGQNLTTNEVKLTVENGGEDFRKGAEDDANKPILQIELGKKEIYQGEVVPVNVSLYVPRQVQLRRLGLIEMEKSDFAIARFPQTNEQSSTIIDGVGYYVLTFRSTLSSLRVGEMKVGPASLELLVETPVEGQQRSMFPQGFGPNLPPGFFQGMSEPRKVEVKSPQVTLRVLALPAEGKPANFSGAVGEFQMTATASPTDLTVGDPISVEIAVSGAGNFDALTTPALVSSGGWKLYPAKRYIIEGPVDQNQTPTLERKIGYTQVVVPEAVHNQVPPFELNYFSPSQKQYVTLRTEPIPLTMKPAPVTAAAESAGTGGTTTVTEIQVPPPVADPQADITDIIVRPPGVSRWLSSSSTLLLHSRVFWSVQAVPVGVFALACMLAAARRRRAEKFAGRAGALRAAWEDFETTSGRSGCTDQDFLRSAAQFIHHVNGSDRATGPVQAVLDRYESTNFTASHASSLDSAARREIHSTLAALMRQSLSKLTVLAISFLLAASSLQAADAPKSAGASPDEVYREAVAEVEKGNFTRAQYLAESLTKKTPPHLSAELFQIIGHARYRQGDMGRAALWYQRARLLDGRDAELSQNLRHIFERTRYLSFSIDSPLREASFFLTTNEWLILAAAGVWLVFLALAWRVLRAPKASGWVVFACVLGVMIAVPAGAFAALRPLGPERVKDISIVTQPDVSSYTSATVTSGSVIALPPGSQVRTLEKRGAWFYVEIPSSPENLRGWVESGAIAPLWIWDADLVP